MSNKGHLQPRGKHKPRNPQSSDYSIVPVNETQPTQEPATLDEALREWGIKDVVINAINEIDEEREEWKSSDLAIRTVAKDGTLTIELRTRIPVAKALTILAGVWATITIVFPQIPPLVGTILAALQQFILTP